MDKGVDEMELISVIVPVYNVENYLERCVTSILKQTYTDLEIILIDDGSTDKSGTICDELQKKDPRIIVVHKENGGQSSARNLGLEICKGTWVCFIDSDDFIREDYIEELHRLCITYNVSISQCGAVRGTASDFPDENIDVSEVKWSFKKMYTSSSRIFRAVVWGKLVKTELARKYPFLTGKIYEDEETSFKYMYEAKECVVTNKHMYYYYMSPQSTLRNTNKRVNFDFVDIFEDRCKFLADHKEKTLIEYTKKELCIRLMLNYCGAKKEKKSKEDIIKLRKLFKEYYHKVDWNLPFPKKEILALRLFYIIPKSFSLIENNFRIIKSNKYKREKK